RAARRGAGPVGRLPPGPAHPDLGPRDQGPAPAGVAAGFPNPSEPGNHTVSGLLFYSPATTSCVANPQQSVVAEPQQFAARGSVVVPSCGLFVPSGERYAQGWREKGT